MSTKNKTRTKDKYRVVYNDTQRIELENEFRLNEYIAIPRKQEIAQKLQLSERQIKIWFQNRRAKKRKQQKRKQLSAVASVTTSSSLGHHHNHNNNHHHHHPHNQQPQQQSSNRSSSDELTRSSISDISSFQHQYQLEGHHLHHNHLNHHPQQPQLISNCGQSVVGYHQNDQLIQQHVSGGGNNENMNSNFELSHQQQQQQQQQQSNLKTTLTTSSGDSPTSSSSLFPIGSSNSTTTGASGDVCDERTNNDQFNETFHENNKLANDTDTAQSSGATANDSNQTALSGQSVIVSNPRLVSTQQQLHHNQPVNQMGACSASTSPTNNTLPPSVDNKREPGSPNSLQTTTATKLNQDKVTSPNPMQHQPARQFYQHQLGRAQAVTTAAAAVAQQLATGNFYDPIYADQVQQPAAYYAGQQQHSTHPQPHHPHPHPHHHPHHHQQHLQSQSGGDSAAFHHGHQQHHNLRQHQLMSSPISGLPTNATNQTSSQLVESCWPHEPASVDVGPGAAVAAATTQSSQPPAGVSQTSISHNHTSSSTPSSSQSTSPAMLNHNGNGNNNNNNHSHHQYHNNHHQFHLGSLPHLAAARAHHAAAAASLPMPSPYIQAASGPHHPVANNATAPANYSITNGYHPNNHPQHPHHHHHHHHHPSHHNNNHSHHQFMIEQHYANSVASAGSTEVAVGGGDQHLTQSLASARPTCSPGEQNHHLTIGSLENSYYYNKATLEASAIHRGSNPLIGKHAIYH